MLKIKTMKMIKGDRVVNLDRSSLNSILKTFLVKHDCTITFDKAWISKPPYGRTTISIPGSINELRISRDLVGRPLGEEVYLNIVEKSRGYYILKVGPARFESSKKQGYSLAEFLQKWQELQPDKYNTWKGGVEMEQDFQKIIIQYGNEYADYWYDCTMDGIDPMSYEEWSDNEQYAQDQIDLTRLTEAERYGD